MVQLTFSACPTTLGVQSCFDATRACVRGGNAKHEGKPQPQVYFTREYTKAGPGLTAEYAQHVTDTACEIAKTHPVYLLRPIPEMGVNIPNTARAMVWGKQKEVTVSLAAYHARNDFAWAAQDAARARCGVKILDPTPYLCWDGVCHSTLNGRPLYFDDNHLSQFGSSLLEPMFASVFKDAKR